MKNIKMTFLATAAAIALIASASDSQAQMVPGVLGIINDQTELLMSGVTVSDWAYVCPPYVLHSSSFDLKLYSELCHSPYGPTLPPEHAEQLLFEYYNR